MPGKVTFQFVESDLREAYAADAVARRGQGGVARTRGVQVIGFLLFLFVATAAFVIVRQNSPTVWWVGMLLPIIPWLLVMCFVLFVAGRAVGKPRKPWHGRQGMVRVPARSPAQSLRPLIGGGVFFALLISLFAFIKLNSVTPPAGRAGPAIDFTPLFYWIVVFVVVWAIVFFLRKRTMGRRWEMLPHWHRPFTAEYDERALVLAEPYSRLETVWEYFEGFLETTNLFMLYSSPMLFHVVPKRAFTDEAGRAEFRELLRRRISDRENAFPVIPLARRAGE